MGHIGLTPQNVSEKKGFKVQGQTAEQAMQIMRQAALWEKRHAFSILLECIPSVVASAITKALKIPTIGIGAGPGCDGQVLVFQDLVGTFTKFKPRFVKQYAELNTLMKKAVGEYKKDVRLGRFPESKHSFLMSAIERDKFLGKR